MNAAVLQLPAPLSGRMVRNLIAAVAVGLIVTSCIPETEPQQDGGYAVNDTDSHGRTHQDPHYGESGHSAGCTHR